LKTPSVTSSETDVNDIDKIAASDWIGFNVLLGPEEGSELSVPSANMDPFPRMTATATLPSSSPRELVHRPAELGELHFHINGMYVDPSARGAGLGRKLMDAALDRAKMEARAAKVRSRVSLSVYSHNVAAMKLYQASGLKVLKTEKSRSRPEYVAVHMEVIEPAVAE
jgi:ribosomal protein S18 acetylase RimI-like enzyme